MAVTRLLNVCREVVETFRSQKVAVATSDFVAAQLQLPGQLFAVRVLRFEHRMTRAPLSVKALGDGNRFEQRRFAGAVFADEKCHPWMQLDRRQFFDRGNGIRKHVERIHPLAAERHRLEKRWIGR
jgi:hypothetical protein